MNPVFGAAGLVCGGTTTSSQSFRSLTTVRTVPALTMAAVPRKLAVQIVDSFWVTRTVVWLVCAIAGAAHAASAPKTTRVRAQARAMTLITSSLRYAEAKQRAARLDESESVLVVAIRRARVGRAEETRRFLDQRFDRGRLADALADDQ